MTRLIAHREAVRFSECDGLGHVNNAVFLTYLEQARFALWRVQLHPLRLPVPLDGPRGEGIILARAEIDFRSQLRFGEVLEIRVSLAGFGTSSFRYEYEIVTVPDERLVANARTVQVWFDYDRDRPVTLPETIKQKLLVPVL